MGTPKRFKLTKDIKITSIILVSILVLICSICDSKPSTSEECLDSERNNTANISVDTDSYRLKLKNEYEKEYQLNQKKVTFQRIL